MLIEIIDEMSQFLTVVSVIINLVTFAVLLKNGIKYLTDLRFLKKVLGIQNKCTIITYSIFEASMQERFKYRTVTYKAILAMGKVIRLLEKFKYKYEFSGSTREYGVCDEIHIGGPLTNKAVNTYIITHLPGFKFYTQNYRKKRFEKYPINKHFIQYNDNAIGFELKKGQDEIFLEHSEYTDYAILIKLIPNDFCNTCSKTVHILFGGTDTGTLKAVEFFETYYKAIYKKFSSNHYIIAVPVNLVDGTFDLSKGFFDLTKFF